jgi:hypothetical protein
VEGSGEAALYSSTLGLQGVMAHCHHPLEYGNERTRCSAVYIFSVLNEQLKTPINRFQENEKP